MTSSCALAGSQVTKLFSHVCDKNWEGTCAYFSMSEAAACSILTLRKNHTTTRAATGQRKDFRISHSRVNPVLW